MTDMQQLYYCKEPGKCHNSYTASYILHHFKYCSRPLNRGGFQPMPRDLLIVLGYRISYALTFGSYKVLTFTINNFIISIILSILKTGFLHIPLASYLSLSLYFFTVPYLVVLFYIPLNKSLLHKFLA